MKKAFFGFPRSVLSGFFGASLSVLKTVAFLGTEGAPKNFSGRSPSLSYFVGYLHQLGAFMSRFQSCSVSTTATNSHN